MKILFMTIGTGIGKDEEKVKNLAHGILFSILNHLPDKVVFFGSEKSKRTLEEIRRQYLEKRGKELDHEFVEIKNIDDFYDCYVSIENKVKEYEGNEVIIDYTSGTKTMTTSAAIVAMLYQKSLFVTSGKREESGVVKPGTEVIKSQNLFAAYDKYLMDKAKEAFNSYRYEDAKNYLKQIVELEEKDDYLKLVEMYDSWDKFNHEKARELMNEIRVKERIFNLNKSFLGKLQNAKEKNELVEEFLIPDLINNAKRRIEEGKYDDAVARLYRCIEMITQYILKKKYGVDPSDLDTWRLRIELGMEENVVEKYERGMDKKGKIKLSLNGNIELLKDLGDELGSLRDDKKLSHLLSKRNSSILAHGIEPIKKEDVEDFYEKTIDVAKKVIEDLEEKMEMATFPKL